MDKVHNINSLQNVLLQHGNNQDIEISSEDELEEGIDLEDQSVNEEPVTYSYGKPTGKNKLRMKVHRNQ